MVMRNIHKPVYDNDLDYYLLPPSVFGMEEVLTRGFSGRVARVIDNLSVPLMIAVLIAPPIFVGYAFFRCFTVYGFKDILVWISLVIST
jgi:hypothetical protein